METGQERPEKKHTRTGISGGAEVQDRQENPGKKRPRIGTSGAAKGGGSGGKTRQGEDEQER